MAIQKDCEEGCCGQSFAKDLESARAREPKPFDKTERKANEQAAKEEQRKAIAVELAEWNEGQLAVRLA